MRRVLENTDHLTIRQAEVAEILTEESRENTGPLKRNTEKTGSRRAAIR